MPRAAADLLDVLARKGKTLSLAESFTGGRILDALTDIPGSSRVLLGGIVTYSDVAKMNQLGVAQGTLKQHGAVSGPVAVAMAEGARRLFESDYAVATTGIAGPMGATPGKPVGLSYCAASGPRHAASTEALHPGTRSQIKEAAVAQSMEVLAAILDLEGTL